MMCHALRWIAVALLASGVGAIAAAQQPAGPVPAELPRPQDVEPGVNTSAPVPAAPAAQPKQPPPGAPSKRPAAAASRAPGRAMDRLELDPTQITGNRELPKVLYIVPWKRSDLGDLIGKPVNSLLDEVLAPVDRDVFRRENRYYEALKPDAPPGAPAPGRGTPTEAPAPAQPQTGS
jgi:hypothetical protein